MRILNSLDLRVVMCFAAVLLASNVMAPAYTPDNAALFYYQAFLLYEEPNETTNMVLADFLRTGELASDEAIIQHVEANRRVIELVVAAADVSMCHWGYDYSRGTKMAMPTLAPLKRIVFLLSAEARWLADQGNFTTALDRCVTVRKMAAHSGHGPIIPWFHGIWINDQANGIIEDILDVMPPDMGELNRLKSRLIQTQAKFPSLASCLRQETHMNAGLIHRDKGQQIVDFFGNSLAAASAGQMLKRIREGDDRFFEKNRDYYLKAMARLVVTLESGLPYAQICTRLDDLSRQWSHEAEENPDATVTSLWLSVPPFGAMIRQETHVNALRTAIYLYITKAQTGHLPDTLPADSPLDMFSGKPFAYAETAEGFILRCQGKEYPNRDKVHEYEFKVR